MASGLVGLLLLASCSGSSPDETADETSVTSIGRAASDDEPARTTTTTSVQRTTTASADTTTSLPSATTTTSPEAHVEPGGDSGHHVISWSWPELEPLVPDEISCTVAWSDRSRPAGELTFAREGAVLNVDPDSGEVTCIALLDRDPTSLDWNPAGDRLLVDSDLLLTADGTGPSGFEPGRTDVTWSQPSGTSLIAPSPDGSELLHVDTRSGEVVDIASLSTTWAAAYHPSGLAVVSAGIDENGVAGLFLADNRGGQRSLLVFLDDPVTKITEVAFAPDGSAVYFVHDHTEGTTEPGVVGHVHRFEPTTAVLTDLAVEADVVPTDLRVSERDDGTATWRIDHSTATSTLELWRGGDVESRRVAEWKIDVVGTIDDGTLAALLRPVASSDPGELWLIPADDEPVLIARGVSAAATRAERATDWSEPPLSIEQRAVG